MIYFWARTIPQRPAIIQPTGVTTYGTLADGIEKAAEYFAKSLPDRSKPITIWLASPPKMLLASLGLLRINCSMIVAGGPELAYIPLSDSNTLIYDRDENPPGDKTNIAFDNSWLEVGIKPSRPSRSVNKTRTRVADIVFFTSGVTTPRRIVQTQRAWDQCILFNGTSTFVDYERALLTMDLTSVTGFTRAYEVLYAGKTLCFARQGLPQLWLANGYDVDLLIASPQQAVELADLQEKVTHYSLAALKTVRLEGAVLAADDIGRIKTNLGRNVIVNYSSAEAGIVAAAPHDVIADVPNAAGFVIPEAEVQIVDAEDHILPAGSEGFVRVRTAQFLRNFEIEDLNTWLYPGDIGWLTEDGLLCIAAREADVVRRTDVEFSMTDFDDYLMSCPGVKDAGVCTQTGVTGRKEIWLGVVFEPSADFGAFRKAIDACAGFGMNIDKLYVVEAIPRDSLGNIQRDELRATLQTMSE